MVRCAKEGCWSKDLFEIYIGAYDSDRLLCKHHAAEEWQQYRKELWQKTHPGVPYPSKDAAKSEEKKKRGRQPKEKAPAPKPKAPKGPSLASIMDPLLFEGKHTIAQIAQEVERVLGEKKDYIPNVASRIYYLEKAKKMKVVKTEAGLIHIQKGG